MKYQNILNAIVNDVQSTMLRLGVNCQFTLGVDKDYRNEEYIKITGCNFFMQPMIFKNIHVEGIVKSVVNEKEDSVDFIVSLEYRYTTWDTEETEQILVKSSIGLKTNGQRKTMPDSWKRLRVLKYRRNKL